MSATDGLIELDVYTCLWAVCNGVCVMKIPLTMDDGPNSAPHNGQLGASTSSATNSSTVKSNNNEDNNLRTQLSMPGILHYLQHEWARFEMERNQWDSERAELQVYVFSNTCDLTQRFLLLCLFCGGLVGFEAGDSSLTVAAAVSECVDCREISIHRFEHFIKFYPIS